MENRDFFNAFPVGYHQFHPDVSLNFQMNRIYNFAHDEVTRSDLDTVAPRIQDYADMQREFLALAEKEQHSSSGSKLRQAFYLRAAEFFMFADNPDKQPTRKRFKQLLHELNPLAEEHRYEVPYEGISLPAYRFTPEPARGTIVLFGGFDSYIEEYFGMLSLLYKLGYDTILFEGPGQGSVLEDLHVPMTPEWEKPVKAVLDFFQVDNITLLGFSLGGELVMRAAAFEPRVSRVIANDVLSDHLDVVLQQFDYKVRPILKQAFEQGNKQQVNALLEQQMQKSLVIEWVIKHGMHVMGATTPYGFFQKSSLYRTSEISAKLEQDVLLLAAAEDHYVPLYQLTDQISTLTNVRSLTVRLFTRREQAQNHCQIGNLGLSLRVMVDWIENL
jgi:pimeloyl-ACP methyl ester carboxylesterase